MGCGSSKTGTIQVISDKGSVVIKSTKFKVSYDPDSESILASVVGDKIILSELTWSRGIYEITDLECIDVESNESVSYPPVTMRFTINSSTQQFDRMINYEEVADTVIAQQGGTANETQKEVLMIRLEKECKEIWEAFRGHWCRKVEKRETLMEHVGRDCKRIDIAKVFEREELEPFLRSKMAISNLVTAEREIFISGILEKKNSKPHIVKTRKKQFIAAEIDRDRYIEIDDELKVLVFCWKDLPELSSDELFANEHEKLLAIQENFIENAKKLLEDIS